MQNKKNGSILVLGESHADPIAGHLALQMAKACYEQNRKFVICYEYPDNLKDQEVVNVIGSRVNEINDTINHLTQLNFIAPNLREIDRSSGYPRVSMISASGLSKSFFNKKHVDALRSQFETLKLLTNGSVDNDFRNIDVAIENLSRKLNYESVVRSFQMVMSGYNTSIVAIDKITDYNEDGAYPGSKNPIHYFESFETERINHMVGKIRVAYQDAGDCDVAILVICGASHARRLAANLKLQQDLSHMNIESMISHSQYNDFIVGNSIQTILGGSEHNCKNFNQDSQQVINMYNTTPCEIFGDGVEHEDGSMSSESFTRFMNSALRALEPTHFYIPDWNEDKHRLLNSIGGELFGVEAGYAKISVLSSSLLRSNRDAFGILRSRVELSEFADQVKALSTITHITIEQTSYANKVLVTYPSTYKDQVTKIVDHWSDYKELSLPVSQDRSSWRIGALASAAAVSLVAYIGRSEISSAWNALKSAVLGSSNEVQSLSRNAN